MLGSLELLQLERQPDEHATKEERKPGDRPDESQCPCAWPSDQHGAECMTALVLLVFIAVWAIIIGVLQLYAAIQLWKVIDNDWWLILSGLLSIAFGAVLIAWPSTGALALIWTIAWFTVFFGCMFIGLAFELKKFKRT